MGDLSTREQIRADSACDATTRVVGFSCPDGTIQCELRSPHDMHFNRSHCRTGHSWFDPVPPTREQIRAEAIARVAGSLAEGEGDANNIASRHWCMAEAVVDALGDLIGTRILDRRTGMWIEEDA